MRTKHTPSFRFDFSDGSLLLALTRGDWTRIDIEDFELLAPHTWYSSGNGELRYARNRRLGLLHVALMQPPDGFYVDHINRDTLDNRRQNLRIVTAQQNSMNKRVRRESGSGYKGVFRQALSGRWAARITYQGKHTYLGTYDTPEEAARVYDEAALRLHGPYAHVNFPESE